MSFTENVHMSNLEPLGFGLLYSVSKITLESFNYFRRSVICFGMLTKKFKFFSLALKLSEKIEKIDGIRQGILLYLIFV